ncbi:MAG: hypothetical protein HY438_01945 [DPANN group archaeon]|nr:hypothetical protein [DPANN group archaeon]
MAPGKWKEVLADLEPSNPEKALRLEKEEGIEETLAKMFKIYAGNEYGGRVTDEKHLEYRISDIKSSGRNITKQVVEEFFLQVVRYEDIFVAGHGHYYSQRTGLFASALIQASFEQGHNNFELLLFGNRPISDLGYKLRGEPARRLSISITTANQPNSREPRPSLWLVNMQYVDATILGLKCVPSFLVGNSKDCTFASDSQDILDAISEMGQHPCKLVDNDKHTTVYQGRPADAGLQVMVEA